MDLNVLNLGERVLLAARLATIEHVRLELAAEAAADARRMSLVGDGAVHFADDAAAEPLVELTRPVGEVLGDVFKQLETRTRMPRVHATSGKIRGAA